MEILILMALIVLNGVFAMSELALVTARRARLQKMIDEGDSAAAAALRLGEDPTRFLSTIQIGITSIGVLNGIFGEAALAVPVARMMETWGMAASTAGTLSTALVVVLITYVSIVVGELVPKRLGQANPEMIARIVARPIDWLARLTKPFVQLLSLSTAGLLRLLGVHERNDSSMTADEINAVLQEGANSGVIEANEHVLVRNVFNLDDRQISSLMVPRSDLSFIDINAGFEEILEAVETHGHSRYPVVDGNLYNLIGVLNARRWMTHALRGERSQEALRALVEEPLYVPETITGLELLDKFKNTHIKHAFVIDEYGELQGMVTVNDLLEAITGEFLSDDPSEAWAVQREDGSWLLDGHIPNFELKERLGIKALPEEEHGRYQTLSGLIMLMTGRLPSVTDAVEWDGWRFEVVDMDGKVIDKVQATRLPPLELDETAP